jgi:opacity protein-like surface antigen
VRTTFVAVAFGVMVAVSASPVAAQGRVPATGVWAIGGTAGAAMPSNAGLDNGFELTGSLERYLSPRVSIRGLLGAAWLEPTFRSGTLTPLFVTGNAVYNWEGGAVHPYVTGGVGVYRFNSSIGDRSDTEPGFNAGAGLEYFFTRTAAITWELAYHKVGALDTPLGTFDDGSFWRFGMGAKVYWR